MKPPSSSSPSSSPSLTSSEPPPPAANGASDGTTGSSHDSADGFARVQRALAARGHPQAPRWLDASARTSQMAADALGVAVGQIAKSIVFRRRDDDAAVLVVAAGDRRVDERRLAALVGAIGRADADFVKAKTGFSIGGVAPLAHAGPVVVLIDRELFRFDEIWAAAGHPNGVFAMSPQQLVGLTGAAVVDVAQSVNKA